MRPVERKKVLRGHEEQVLSVAFGAGDSLASGSADGTVRLWDVETGTSRILAGHTDWVFGVAFPPERRIPFQYREGYERTTLGYDIWCASQHAGTSYELGT